MRTKLVAEQRCELIRRVADWCFDETESWEPDNIGTGLAYLFWAIASPDKGVPFDATLENSGGTYKGLIRILQSNPNGLFEELVEGGFIIAGDRREQEDEDL